MAPDSKPCNKAAPLAKLRAPPVAAAVAEEAAAPDAEATAVVGMGKMKFICCWRGAPAPTPKFCCTSPFQLSGATPEPDPRNGAGARTCVEHGHANVIKRPVDNGGRIWEENNTSELMVP